MQNTGRWTIPADFLPAAAAPRFAHLYALADRSLAAETSMHADACDAQSAQALDTLLLAGAGRGARSALRGRAVGRGLPASVAPSCDARAGGRARAFATRAPRRASDRHRRGRRRAAGGRDGAALRARGHETAGRPPARASRTCRQRNLRVRQRAGRRRRARLRASAGSSRAARAHRVARTSIAAPADHGHRGRVGAPALSRRVCPDGAGRQPFPRDGSRQVGHSVRAGAVAGARGARRCRPRLAAAHLCRCSKPRGRAASRSARSARRSSRAMPCASCAGRRASRPP